MPYASFFEDAEEGSRLLGITLTSRNNGGSGHVPLAGVPAKAIDAKNYPNGYPGLPAMPASDFFGHLRTDFPRVRTLAIDKAGNLYAGGTLAEAELGGARDVLGRLPETNWFRRDRKSVV